MAKHQIHPAGYLMILLSSVLFGSYGVWSKLMGDTFGIFFQGWVRSVIVLAILIPVLFLTKGFKRIDKEDRPWVWVTVGFTLFTQVPLYYAFVATSIGTATLLFYALFITTSYVMGSIFFKEAISPIRLIAMGLAFAGLVCVFGFSIAKFSVIGLLMAALNGIASGAEVTSTKKSTQKYSSLLITAYCWLAILVTHLPLSLLLHERQWVPAISTEWLAMVAYSIAGMAAFWLVVEAYKHVDASLGSLIGLLEIIWGVLFGVWFFHEHVSLSVWLGGALILSAGMLPDLVNILQQRTAKIPVEPPREI
jgi:drug/metabolite transporter (DMT)-like permease